MITRGAAPAAVVDAVVEQLWRPASPSGARPTVWAVLDGARDEGIRSLVRYSGMEQACLYAGRLPSQLEAAAPYLVRLVESAHFTRDLLEAGWGRSWGIYFTSRGTLDQLRRHLRTFLRVRDERGQRLIFRYYDPRVLRVFLPTCTPSELEQLFGPVDAYVAEGEDGRSVLRFRRREGEGEGERGRLETERQGLRD
ncbi:MAG TPA: DUF4123 domain-containing protein [Gemmatimonadaceae bacterium]|nr:DUF4123 domain-containing protein [Gemmatimonadaceae bacterium]